MSKKAQFEEQGGLDSMSLDCDDSFLGSGAAEGRVCMDPCSYNFAIQLPLQALRKSELCLLRASVKRKVQGNENN